MTEGKEVLEVCWRPGGCVEPAVGGTLSCTWKCVRRAPLLPSVLTTHTKRRAAQDDAADDGSARSSIVAMASRCMPVPALPAVCMWHRPVSSRAAATGTSSATCQGQALGEHLASWPPGPALRSPRSSGSGHISNGSQVVVPSRRRPVDGHLANPSLRETLGGLSRGRVGGSGRGSSP